MTVKVVRERSDQRRHHRVTAPLFVTHDGHRLKATDWSLGGLRLDAYPGTLPELGAIIGLDVAIPFQGFDVTFKCQAEVVRRIEDSRTFAVKFTDIGERELGLMEHFIDELIRGSMVDVRETIQRIDVPVTPASTKPDPNPLSKIPIGRWPTRTIAFAALYLTIGLFVFGYAGVIAYTNFVRMEVDSAVIASPIESVRSQVNGRITYGKYRQGDQVPKGALLLGVVDNDLERQIDMATIDIKEKTAQLAAHERQLIEELERVDAYSKIEGKNLDQLALEIQSLEAQGKAAAAQFQRLDHLFKQGLTTAAQVENAEKQMIGAQKMAQAKGVELQTRRSLATYNAGSRLYNGQSFQGDRAKVEAQAFLAREHVSVSEKKLQALLDHRDRLAIYAPYAGMLQELPRPDGSMVRLGDVLAVVENPKAREIWAFLRQDEVLSVGLGDEAKVYLPGLSELRKARVLRIDRTIGFVNEMNSTYVWRAPRDRSAKVVLEFSDAGSRPQDDSYRTGMPAVAIFSTRPTNYLIGDMMHRFRMVFGGRPRKTAEDTKLAANQVREREARDRQAQAADTPGTSNKDRIGPPRNYEPTGDLVRDPDAVSARRTAETLKPAQAIEPPAVAAAEPEAAPGALGPISGGIAALGSRVRGLFTASEPADQKPAAAKDASVNAQQPAEPAPVAAARPAAPAPTPRPNRFRQDAVPQPDVSPSPQAAAPRQQPGQQPTQQAGPRAGAIGAWPQTQGGTAARAPVERPALDAPPAPHQPRRTKEDAGGAPPIRVVPLPQAVAGPPASPAALPPVPSSRPAAKPDTADFTDTDDDIEAEERKPPARTGLTSPQTAPGYFTRMKERLRSLFAVKPAQDDDDDWGDTDALAAQPAAQAGPPDRPLPGRPVDPARGPAKGPAGAQPALGPAPALRPAAPAGQRRPAAATQAQAESEPRLPSLQERLPSRQVRLRRAHVAETQP